MRGPITVTLPALAACLVLGCQGSAPPPNIEATVEAAVRAALPASTPTPNLDATVAARVEATMVALPTMAPESTITPELTPSPAHTSAPIPTAQPTLAPKPTATPLPTPNLTPRPVSTPMPIPVSIPTPVPTSTQLPTSTSAPNIENLQIYALQLVNRDRVDHGLRPVVLGANPAAQLHAEDMLAHGYLGHWWSDGRKPYMVYSQTGGTSYAAENAAYSGFTDQGWRDQKCGSLLVRCLAPSPREAIEDLQWSMMYDDADSDWGTATISFEKLTGR